ncbi:MAG: branched-chain amino acid ABC transporter permease [Pseudomonadota bacterium]
MGQLIADGILTGAILSLGAIGVTLTLGILRFANFSHSELVTWGGYFALTFIIFAGTSAETFGPLSFGWPFVAAIIVAAVATALLALLVDALVFSRLRRRGAAEMTLVFASFGVALLLRHIIVLIFGPQAAYYTGTLQFAVEILPGVRVMPDQMLVLALTLLLVVGLYVMLKYTRLGIAMRASAESPNLARVHGIDVRVVVRWTWVIGGGLAAAAGVFYGLTVQMRPEIGFTLLLPLFTAALLGGSGSVFGAVIGGLVIGLSESLSVLIIPTGYKQAVPFLILLLILYLRPRGLFGDAAR